MITPAELERLCKNRSIIELIKQLRIASGMELKECKDAIESTYDGNREPDPSMILQVFRPYMIAEKKQKEFANFTAAINQALCSYETLGYSSPYPLVQAVLDNFRK